MSHNPCLPCVKGGGEPASRRDCFKGKVTFLTNRREQDGRPTLRVMAQPSPPSVDGGDFRRKSEGVFKENNEDHEVVVGELQSKVTSLENRREQAPALR